MNSAAGVIFESKTAPPINTILSIFWPIFGSRKSATPILVRGPTGTRCSFSLDSSKVFMINSTAWRGEGLTSGTGKSAPSNPDTPWISGAVTSSRKMGLLNPRATGTSFRLIKVKIFKALLKVFPPSWFPATVVIPVTFSLSEAQANIIAVISSWPGSQSIKTFFIFPPFCSEFSFFYSILLNIQLRQLRLRNRGESVQILRVLLREQYRSL